MDKIWWNVYNFKDYPPTQYGFAVNGKGICVTANEKVNWMVGKNIEFIKTFFEDKPVILSEINPTVSESEICSQTQKNTNGHKP